LEKELARNYPYNLVVVIQKVQGSSLQDAIDLANAITPSQMPVFLTVQFEMPNELNTLGVYQHQSDGTTHRPRVSTADPKILGLSL
jgi:hypothetical protein